ncbi:putative vea protein [Thermochaetoides thermophila DSM 1495]|uniref:Putative vea protein n=1 Tax=Chaetomium thermophilum (strain DSM 1495 / CBS 144.50 / IMI 039719) TaxID=759272 RepID=G0S007_CHATD|nr:putative vea protein [Thermochaetoides thermophila DSM 1495]EGS23168.1 putative vea protein [Thermochaetoides thermophila DSM 1495]
MGAPIAAAPNHSVQVDTTGAVIEPAVISRETKGGRRLWYSLKVIQQPERARACGSGPKSSADRRPVDPPPVVELRIFEGATWQEAQQKDITFHYNANFFLYATLEHARLMAHPRGAPAPPANVPVLTGMPVSGMAYLDRPIEAGYFLFPDLSVRHEGRYRLSFNLYEQTKEEKDKDKDACNADLIFAPISDMNHPAAVESFDWRMEVKSAEFIVYSAKKFPGLAESTQLSRVVAEQGCRVRIRRDVRMRRRDNKGSNRNNEDGQYRNDRRTATPEGARTEYHERARSMSGSQERTPYPAEPHRRPSMHEYHAPPPPPPPQYSQQNSGPAGRHLQFLTNSNSQYPGQPQQSYSQAQSVPQSPVGTHYQPPPSYANPPPPPPPPSAPARSYSRERTPGPSYQPAPPATTPILRREGSQPSEHSRPPSQSCTLPPINNISQFAPSPGTVSQHTPPPPPPLATPTQHHASLAPLQPSTKENKVMLPPIDTSRISNSRPRPTLPSPATLAAVPRPPSLSAGPINPLTLPPPPPLAGSKRARDETFAQPAVQRYQDGQREKGAADDLPSEYTGNASPMWFERANGHRKDALKLNDATRFAL